MDFARQLETMLAAMAPTRLHNAMAMILLERKKKNFSLILYVKLDNALFYVKTNKGEKRRCEAYGNKVIINSSSFIRNEFENP